MITLRFVEEKPYSELYTDRELEESQLGCPDELQPLEQLDPTKIPIAHCAHCGERLAEFCEPLNENSPIDIHTIFKLTYDIEAVVKHDGVYYRDMKIFNFLEYAENIKRGEMFYNCPKCKRHHETIYVTKVANIIFIAFI